MNKPENSFVQNLSISYECSLSIGNSLILEEMLNEVIHTIVHKTNAHRGTIWLCEEKDKNGIQIGARAGSMLTKEDISRRKLSYKTIFGQICSDQKPVMKYKDDKKFCQYCTNIMGKEEAVLIIPIKKEAILHLVYFKKEIVNETLANMLNGLSAKLSIAIKACIEHENIKREVRIRQETKEMLKYSERQYRTTIDSINKSIHVIDKNFNIVLFNKTFKQWNKKLGFETKNLIGTNIFEVFPFLPDTVHNEYKKVFKTGKTLLTVDANKLAGKRIITETRKIPILKNNKVARVVTVMDDITKRKKSEQVQSVLNNIAKAVNATTSLNELYSTIHQLLSTIIDTSNFYIANYNEDTDEITASYFVDEKIVVKVPFQLRKNGVTNYIIKNAKSLFLTEELRKELINKGKIANYAWTSKTLLGVPLRIEKKIVGCIVVRSYKEESKFSEKDLSILELASYQIAIAVVHKQAEETLIENEEKYRILIEKNQDGVFLIQDGLMKLINPAFASMIGYTVNELIDMDFQKLLAPEDVDMVADRYSKRQTGENIPSEYEFKMLCKDGKTLVDVSMNAGIIKFKGKIASIGTIHNITKRKQLQKESEKLYKESEESKTSLLSILEDVTEKEVALRKSEERFQDVVTNTGDWIWETDEKGRYTYCSPVVKQVLGYEYKEVLGKYFYDFTHQNDRDKLKKNIFEIFRKRGKIHNFINLNVHKDGRIIFLETSAVPLLDDKGSLLGYRGVDRDITERVQTKKIQETLYNISNAVNTTDKIRDLFSKIREYLGNVIDTTNFYVALYDEKTDMISLPFDVDEKDNYEVFPAGKTLTSFVIKTGKPLFANKKLQDELTKQGKIDMVGTPSKIWLGVPLKIENKVIGVIAVQSYDDTNLYTEKDIEILTFISEEIALAIKHKEAEEQIKRNLKEKDTLLQELYHRTKNNMQVVISMLKMQSRNIDNGTLSDSADIDFLHESFNEVINKIKAMSLVHQKLYQADDLSHINLKSYIGDLIRLLMVSYKVRTEKISLNLELEDVFVLIDSAIPLGLVLNEMISNVFKHAFPDNAKGEISLRLYKDENDTINIYLSDNGIGIQNGINPAKLNTMGLQTVFDLIIYQLKGKITYKTENGLKWQISFRDDLHKERI